MTRKRPETTFTATFHGATRKGNSVNGNPTWLLHTSEGDFTTQSDASLGYSVSNYIGRTGDSLVGKRVKFTGTLTRRIWHMEPAE